MTNQTQDSLSSPQSSYLETIFDPLDGSSKLLSTISSANFNGAIPDLVIQYPNAVTDDLIPGRFFLVGDTYYLITRIDENIDPTTTDTISYNVWYTAGGMERYKTILSGVKIFTDGTELQIRKDDWSNKTLGSFGWTITTEGNSIFSNVAIRGTIQATDGYFDGFLVIGDPLDPEYPGSMKIGTNVNSTNDGIFINANNYWYDTGLLSIGNSTNSVVWNGTALIVTGQIIATTGTIGGFNIGATSLTAGSGSNSVGLAPATYPFYAGSVTAASAPFRVLPSGEVIASSATITGTINASAGNFEGFVTAGSMKIGKDVQSTNDGIYINSNNYWYDSGLFKLGNSTKNVIWNNTDLSVTGDINATGGIFSGKVKIGNMYLGVDASPTLENGIYIDGTNYWYDDGNFSLGTGTNTISFNGSNIIVGTGVNIAGEISANSLLLTSGGLNMSIKSNHTPVASSQRIVTKVILSGTSPQLAEFTTSSSHPFVAGDFIYISGLSNSGGGLGSLNKVFQVSSVSANIINVNASSSTKSISVNADNSDTTLSVVSSTGVYAGMAVSGTGIQAGTTVVSTTATIITISSPTTQSLSSISITFSPINGTYDYTDAGWTNGQTEYSYDGIYVNQNNYWYSNGLFGIGDGTKGVVWDGLALNVTGVINASAGGSIAGWSIGSDEIYKGTGASKIALNAGATPKIYIGTGTHGTSNTPFYVDNTGAFSLSNQLIFNPASGQPGADDFAELTVVGKIRGSIENVSQVPSNKLFGNISKVQINSTTQATITMSAQHAFLTNEYVVIEGVTGTNYTIVNGVYQITSIPITDPASTKFTIAISGGVVSADTSKTGTVNLRELTLGLHPSESGTTGHDAGIGIRLDKTNWWFTNNQFRIGSSASYIQWNGSNLDISGSVRIGNIASSTVVSGAASGASSLQPGTAAADVNANITTISGSKIRTGIIESTGYAYTSGNFSTTGTQLDLTNGLLRSKNFAITSDGSAFFKGDIAIGSGESIFKADSNGIYLGSATFANAEFRVTPAGSLTATNANITGVINAQSGTFTGAINAQSGTFAGNVDFGINLAEQVRVGPTASQGGAGIFYNPDNYWLKFDDGSVSFHLGDQTDGLDYYQGQLEITGTVSATSGRFGGDTGWLLTESGVLSSGLGSSYLALASRDAEISETTNQTFTISQIIIDDEAFDNYDGEYPTANVNYSTFYIKIPIAQAGFYRTATRLTTTNSTVITVDSSVGLFVGMGVTGTGIQAGTTITNVNGKIITLSKITTTAGPQTVTFTSTTESVIDIFDNKYVYFPSGFTSTLSILNDKKFLVQVVDNENYSIVDGDPEDANPMYDYVESTGIISTTHVTIQIYGESAYSIATNSAAPIQVYTNLTTAFPEEIDPDIPQYKDLISVNGSIQGTYTTGISTASYVPKLTQGSQTYMLWAGSENPSTSKLSISQNNSTDKIKIKADMGTTPVGSIVMWYSTAIPTGWMECNGQSTSGYTELAAIVGATVPNFNGRFPLGRGGTIGAALGATGGATTYAYGVAAHSHDMGSTTNTNNLANVATGITEGTVNITEGAIAANTGNHSHGVTGTSSVSSNDTGSRSYSPNLTNTLTPTVAHTHGDGNYATNSAGGTSTTDHTHTIGAFNASASGFVLTNGGIGGDTLGVIGASTANITSVIPPYLGVIFIIYHGVG